MLEICSLTLILSGLLVWPIYITCVTTCTRNCIVFVEYNCGSFQFMYKAIQVPSEYLLLVIYKPLSTYYIILYYNSYARHCQIIDTIEVSNGKVIGN